MTQKELRAAMRSGRRVYGTLVSSDAPHWPDYVRTIGLDYVFIDTEHIALDRKQMSWMCKAYAAMGLPPIVRITSPDPYLASVAIDAGAAGVMVPYVETVEQVKALHGAVKLRPIKGERLQRILDGEEVAPKLANYLQRTAGENILIINVESRPALENLDAILSVEGLDGVLIGPHDLSCSLDIPEEYDSPEFDAAARTIFRKARQHGVAAGIQTGTNLDQAVSWAQEDGLNLFLQSADVAAMQMLLTAQVGELRTKLGDKKESDGTGGMAI
tara:strand:+ start:864 stop:1679 length:816 start_codon:yes stop_codon:yes gene_type:complete